MIISIENYYGETIGAVDINPNDINGEISVNRINGPISVADIDFDDIFDTNDYKIRIQLDYKNLECKSIANSIINHIISTRKGEIYDKEIAMLCINDYLDEFIEEIYSIVNKNMIELYTEEDNLTVL